MEPSWSDQGLSQHLHERPKSEIRGSVRAHRKRIRVHSTAATSNCWACQALMSLIQLT
jgi:hypothetical protein